MTREFLEKVCRFGLVKTRKHYYKRIFTTNYIKIIRDNNYVVAVYVR